MKKQITAFIIAMLLSLVCSSLFAQHGEYIYDNNGSGVRYKYKILTDGVLVKGAYIVDYWDGQQPTVPTSVAIPEDVITEYGNYPVAGFLLNDEPKVEREGISYFSKNITEFIVDPSNFYLSSTADGVLFSKKQDTLKLLPGLWDVAVGGGSTYNIPAKTKVIGKEAMAHNTVLSAVVNYGTVTDIQDGAFAFCYNLEYFLEKSDTDPTGGQYNTFASLTKLGKGVFRRTKISNFYVSKDLNSIADGCFQEAGVGEIVLDPNNNHFALSREGILCTNEQYCRIIVAPRGVFSSNYNFSMQNMINRRGGAPIKVRYIDSYAFQRSFWYMPDAPLSSPLATVDITDVGYIFKVGKGAFSDNPMLRTVTLGGSLEILDEDVFRDCISLKSVVIKPGNLKQEVPNDLFRDCSSLETITTPPTPGFFQPTVIGEYAFANCEALGRGIVNSVPVEQTIRYLFERVNEVKTAAFAGCGNLNMVRATDLAVIGDSAFIDCTKISDMDIHNVQTIGNQAFANCSSIVKIGIPNAKKIGDEAFLNCTKLLQFSELIPGVTDNNNKVLTHLGAGAFRGCSSLEYVKLPKTVTYIGTDAFFDCPKLKRVVSLIVDNSVINTVQPYESGHYKGQNSNRIFKGPYPSDNYLYVRNGRKTTYLNSHWKDYRGSSGIFEFGAVIVQAKTRAYDGTTDAEMDTDYDYSNVIAPIHRNSGNLDVVKGINWVGPFKYSTPDAGVNKVINSDGSTIQQIDWDITYYLVAQGTIEKFKLTVEVHPKEKFEDGQPFPYNEYTAVISDSGIGEDISGLYDQIVYGGPAINATTAGVYEITASGINSNNYEFSYYPANLTIKLPDGYRYVWTGTVSTDWNVAANWERNLVPDLQLFKRDELTEAPRVKYGVKFSPTAVNDLHIPIFENLGYLEMESLENNSNRKTVVPAGGALYVTGDILGSEKSPDRILIKADPIKPNGTFCFISSFDGYDQRGADGESTSGGLPPNIVHGTVEMYVRGHYTPGETVVDSDPDSPTFGQTIKSSRKWQYFGIPVEKVVASPTFNNTHIREYSEEYNGGEKWYSKWKPIGREDSLYIFKGYEISARTPKIFPIKGKLRSVVGYYSNFMTARATRTSTTSTDPLKIYYGIGQNLFGNSFTSAISVKSLFEQNNYNFNELLERTVYLYNTGSFKDWKDGLGSGDNNSVEYGAPIRAGQYLAIPAEVSEILDDADLAHMRIPSMQAFLLKYIIDRTYTISDDLVEREKVLPKMLISIASGNYYNTGNIADSYYSGFKNIDPQRAKAKKEEVSFIKIRMKSKTTVDNLWLIRNSETSDGFDNGWDGTKSFGTNTAYIYTQTPGGNMQIDATNDIDRKLITFVSNGDEEYTLTLIKKNIDSYYSTLSLLDMETNEVLPLVSDTTTYTFTSKPYQISKRFKIVNSDNVTADDFVGNDNLSVVYSNGIARVSNFTKQEGKLIVADISGRLVSLVDVELGTNTIPLQLAKGVYILKVKVGKEEKTLKIITQ